RTMPSRRLTWRLMSRSTWTSPYHLCMPEISMATSLVVVCMRGTVLGRATPPVGCVALSLIPSSRPFSACSGEVSTGSPTTTCASFHSPPVALGEPRLGVSRVAGHPIAEDEIKDRRHRVAGGARHRGRPLRVDARGFDRAQQVEHADDRHQR